MNRKLNRDAIKYIAVAAMTCNHFAHIFLQPDTLVYEVLVDIGYFTAVTMCYFLVEGYYYTHDKNKYWSATAVFRNPFANSIYAGAFLLAMEYALYSLYLLLDLAGVEQ